MFETESSNPGPKADCPRGSGELELDDQRNILELVASGAPLGDVLPTINRLIESQIPGALCSVLRLQGSQMWNLCGDSLPAAYLQAIEGFTIGVNVGSCGNAAYTGRLTIVDDLATHSNWSSFRKIALPYGLRSAWSMPIRAPNGDILGTFGIYTRHPATPTPEQIRLIGIASHLAGLAMAQQHSKQMLEERAEALADADRRKDAFLATLGHELRNPLAAINSAVELMKLDRLDPGLQAEATDIMGRQVAVLVRLVDDLLDASRITQGKVRLHRAPCAVADVVALALELMRATVDEGDQSIEVDGPPAPIHIDGDCARLVQVIANLIGNASKYTPRRGSILVTWRPADEDVVIEVRDNGEGIPPELLPHLFDLFVQGERTLDKAKGGLGIGLTVVRTIVELHGGSVSAASCGLGKGSVFTLRLPAVAYCATTPAPEVPHLHGAVVPSREGRVLVVDDNRDAAKLLGAALLTLGYEVRTVGDGISALRVASQWRPHAVLLDVGLPRLDGYEVAKALRTRASSRPMRLIALSGYGQSADLSRALGAGFDTMLVKPASLAAVSDALAGLEIGFSERATPS